MNKVKNADDIMKTIKDDSSIMVGGFGLVGCPLLLIKSLVKSKKKNLTIISNNLGEPGKGLGELVINNQVIKAIGSFFTSNIDVVDAYKKGKIEIELLPQGTLSESIRAGGSGIAGFYTPVSVDTLLSKQRDVRVFNGRKHILQEAIIADYAFIKAEKADDMGNLIYSKSARNFNPIMATAAKTTIVEVEEIVDVGSLSPEEIITPHIYVDYIVEKGR